MSATKVQTCSECGAKHYGRGMCYRHYMRWFRANRDNMPPRRQRPQCSVEGCSRPNEARSYCSLHYKRLQVLGRTDLPTVEDRFWAKVDRDDPSGCWLWTGSISGGTGYGNLSIGAGKQVGAHRYSYELHKGPIPPNLSVDHLCCVRRCVNPAHLEAVTQAENVRRAARIGYGPNAPRTCKRGHDWDAHPPYLATRPYGVSRRCRVCLNEYDARRRAARRSA